MDNSDDRGKSSTSLLVGVKAGRVHLCRVAAWQVTLRDPIYRPIQYVMHPWHFICNGGTINFRCDDDTGMMMAGGAP